MKSKRKALERAFFDRPPQEVARDLLGVVLVRQYGGAILQTVIMEAEAYHGEEDLACHASHGLTARTRVMYGPPGMAYVYFTYGSHWMLNVVTEEAGKPSAVLVRAIWPLEGLEEIKKNRPRPMARKRGQETYLPAGWTDGPGKLCQALRISGALNGTDLCDPASGLYLSEGIRVPEEAVTTGPRVGISTVPEPWLSKPWRYVVDSAWLAGRIGQAGKAGQAPAANSD